MREDMVRVDWNRASNLIMSSRTKKNLDFILGTSQKLSVTFSRMKEERDIPFFILKMRLLATSPSLSCGPQFSRKRG